MKKTCHNQQGFILPLTMILSLLLLAFAFHGLFLLNSDRNFDRHAVNQFIFQQLRECALVDVRQELHQGKQMNQGSYSYHQGTVHYDISENADAMIVTLTIEANGSSETDRVTFSKETLRPTDCIERVD